MPVGTIESLDHAGQGIARDGGKTIFVEGALPGELVSWLSYRRKPSFEQARVTEVHRAASARVAPRCPHFGVCGGARCSMLIRPCRLRPSNGCLKITYSTWATSNRHPSIRRFRALPGITASVPECRYDWCLKRAVCWWGSTNGAAATLPT